MERSRAAGKASRKPDPLVSTTDFASRIRHDPLPSGLGSAGKVTATSDGTVVENPGVGDDAWSTFSLLISGLLVWGGAGWLVDRLLGYQALFLPVGMFLGMGAALYVVFTRYGRAPAPAATMKDHRDRE